MCELAAEHGSFAAWLAAWPESDVVGLWEALAKRFSQMGGNSGAYFLRMAGKDSFILTPFVVKALNRWGAFAGEPKGKAARAQVQSLFNAWAAETGAALAHLSMMLAASVE
jgi:3-methyladenine DNA glycosylase Tag